MKRNNTLAILRKIKPVLAQQFCVTEIALFGSTACDEAKEHSDVDILVGFDGPATSARYFVVQFYIEDQLGYPVDLVTEKALRPELRSFIEREAIHV
ncbi:MAG: nucleotidyltransferase family protein [Methylobacter sp.]